MAEDTSMRNVYDFEFLAKLLLCEKPVKFCLDAIISGVYAAK